MESLTLSRRQLVQHAALAATVGPGLLASAAAGQAGAAPPKTKPVERPDNGPPVPTGPVKNVLWICTDQQRWDTMGVTGNPWVRTPNLDRLAEEGVLFERAYCNSPVCIPSRSSFLSGLYPSTCGVRSNRSGFSDGLLDRLLPRRLHRYGFNCGLAGKLHVRGDWRNSASPESGYDHGYDEFNWSPCGFPDNWGGCQYQHWLRDRGVSFDIRAHPDSQHVFLGMPAEHHQTTWCAQRAITFMQAMAEKQPDQPWMFACNIFDPHHPNDPPPELLERYDAVLDELPLPDYVPGELDGKPSVQRETFAKGPNRMPPNPTIRYHELSDREHRLFRASYFAMIDLIDMQVGRILDALETSGQRDETLVIFTSDHGESLGDHGMYLKGYWFYEESVRVPLILSWPGATPRDRRPTAFAELVDLAPTIGDALGIDRPAWLEGQSLWPSLTGGPPPRRDYAFCEMGTDGDRDVAMIRTEGHKLVRHYLKDEGELYDMTRPHGERTNLWDDLALADVRSALLAKLDAHRSRSRQNRARWHAPKKA